MDRIVGYEVERSPAGVRFPAKKAVVLQDALRSLAALQHVSIRTLRSAVGVWIWGALLRRELLCIPHAIFKFMDRYEGRVALWWPSARHELRIMADLIQYMFADIGAPLSPVLFASDAQGLTTQVPTATAEAGGWLPLTWGRPWPGALCWWVSSTTSR